jgi:hypothetical protein
MKFTAAAPHRDNEKKKLPLPHRHRDGIKIQFREFHFPKIRKYALSNVCELL